ncbi:glycoside hydrolase family 76 protein [Hypoxylon sp. FL1284]|nr:glycoside hydrolase family 76 protein [Hypoxylon sp. FL1284]
MTRLSAAVAAIALATTGATLELDVKDQASIKEAAAQVAKGLYLYHDPSAPTGQFTQPESWYWWLSGSAWNGLMDYTVYTGDTTYQADLLSALGQNAGPNHDFAPPEQASWEANDDQAYWVYNALSAMEYEFEALPCEGASGASGSSDCANSWQAIGANAFDEFASRWARDSATCAGGLKWQYTTTADGYFYKNAVSNGGFFQTAARLARHTRNATYGEWAARVWDWSAAVGFVDAEFRVFDGAGDEGADNCSAVNRDQWSYNAASYAHGAAHMYAYTNGSEVWEDRARGLVEAARDAFFGPTADAPDVMYEQKCEKDGACDGDQTSFKASMARWLGKTAVLVPSLAPTILPLLEASAAGAAASCSGYENSTCGMKWYTGEFDGNYAMGVELSALEVIQSLLAASAPNMTVTAR